LLNPKSEKPTDPSTVKLNKPPQDIYKCVINNCNQVFFEPVHLKKHIDDHNQTNKMSQLEKATLKYINLINNVRTQKASTNSTFKEANIDDIAEFGLVATAGYALKTRKHGQFSEKQRNFLAKKFKIGLTGGKITAIEVANLMRNSGEFECHERLTEKQITSYFSNLKSKNVSGKLELDELKELIDLEVDLANENDNEKRV
jgi:hypothetical protein